MAKKFRKGEIIQTMDGLLACQEFGWVFYKDRPLAFSFIGHMSLFTVIGSLQRGLFHEAVPNA